MNRLSPTHRRLLAWLAVLLWAGLIYAISAQPQDRFRELGLTGTLLSFGGHFVSYAVLMFLLATALRQEWPRAPASVLTVTFLVVALYGVSDEFHQSFVPGRRATVSDWLVDLLGALVAGGLLWVRWAKQRRDEADPDAV